MRAKAPVSALLDVARRFRTGMLVTVAPGGALRSRPMCLARVDDDGTFWFVTVSDAGILDDLRTGEAAFTATDERHWIHVFGHVRVVHDPEMARSLWRSDVGRWVPQGPDHETTVLIQLSPKDADFWDLGSRGLRERPLHATGGDDLREGHVSF